MKTGGVQTLEEGIIYSISSVQRLNPCSSIKWKWWESLISWHISFGLDVSLNTRDTKLMTPLFTLVTKMVEPTVASSLKTAIATSQ